MSREIKFRAWDGLNKKMVTHFSINNTKYKNFGKISFFLSDIAYCNENQVDNVPKVEELKIMQYTGFKDKNGVEIYEGDIVSTYYYSENCNAKVFWNDAKARFDLKYFEYSSIRKSKGMRNRLMTVVGNIYENPELI